MTRTRNKLEAKFLAVLLLAGPASVLTPVAVAAKAAVPVAAMPAQGIITQVSDYGFDETIVRIKGEIATKGIRFFDEIDQTKLGADAKLPIGRSTLLLFGNPPLGVTFLQSNPLAGLDWPVRMLVTEDPKGAVHVSWTDFRFIANRYGLPTASRRSRWPAKSPRRSPQPQGNSHEIRTLRSLTGPLPRRDILAICVYLNRNNGTKPVDACVNRLRLMLEKIVAAARMQ